MFISLDLFILTFYRESRKLFILYWLTVIVSLITKFLQTIKTISRQLLKLPPFSSKGSFCVNRNSYESEHELNLYLSSLCPSEEKDLLLLVSAILASNTNDLSQVT